MSNAKASANAVLLAALALTGRPLRAEFSPFVRQINPAENATVAVAGPADKVGFEFDLDMAGIINTCPLAFGKNQHYATEMGVRCLGPQCVGAGKGGLFIDETTTATHLKVAFPVSAFLKALGTQTVPKSQAFAWNITVFTADAPGADPPTAGKVCAATEQPFVLVAKVAPPPPGPPDLQVKLDPDTFTAWPARIVVSNKGTGKSEATFLQAKATLLDGGNDAVKAHCRPRFTSLGPVEILELAPGAVRDVAIPVDPSVLTVSLPAGPQRGTTVGPTPTPNPVHQSVTCRFQIQASLGADTNKADPSKANNSLTRTIQFDVPYDPAKKAPGLGSLQPVR